MRESGLLVGLLGVRRVASGSGLLADTAPCRRSGPVQHHRVARLSRPLGRPVGPCSPVVALACSANCRDTRWPQLAAARRLAYQSRTVSVPSGTGSIAVPCRIGASLLVAGRSAIRAQIILLRALRRYARLRPEIPYPWPSFPDGCSLGHLRMMSLPMSSLC